MLLISWTKRTPTPHNTRQAEQENQSRGKTKVALTIEHLPKTLIALCNAELNKSKNGLYLGWILIAFPTAKLRLLNGYSEYYPSNRCSTLPYY
jgi:hypothetical protein